MSKLLEPARLSVRTPLYLATVSSLAVLGGCATMHSGSSGGGGVNPKTDGGAVGMIIRESTSESGTAYSGNSHSLDTKMVNSANIEIFGRKLKHTKFDYPVVVNPVVEQWITYFTGKGRRYFEKYLARGRYFIPTISRVLKQHNMPQDLVYLAMIESGFNNSAKSRARAVGPWQFIRQTGQRYGLVVDYWLDERRDTRKSTLAAIAYLKELYQEFGSWELAAAGYNAGENKVRRAIGKYRSNDFWEIARHRFFKRETRDYVPKIMAAAILTKNCEQFGFISPFEKKAVKNPTVLAENAEDEEVTPKELGEPVAKSEEATDDPADKSEGSAENSDDALADADEDAGGDGAGDDDRDNHAMVSSTPNPTLTPSMYMVANPNEQIIEFEIKGPADLFAISKASGLPYSTLKLLNPELLRWCTPPSMKTYRVKLPLSVKERFLATYNDESFDRKVVFMKYTVRRGDSIQTVARRFNIEGTPIRELNQLGLRANDLRAGSSIVLPVPTGYKRVIASMYDDKPEKASRRSRRRRVRRATRRHTSENARHYRLKPNVLSSERKG